MPIPTHTSSCYTKTFPCKCPDCNRNVYYLSCNCGSKVFFNSLGGIWPIHECNERLVREAIEFLQGVENYTNEEVYNWIDKSGRSIPDEFIQVIENQIGKRKLKPTIMPMEFDENISSLVGSIIEINKDINFFKKISGEKNEFTEKLLNELTKEKFSEIKIREQIDDLGFVKEYKIFATNSLINRFLIQKNSKVAVQIRQAKSIWKCWVVTGLQKL
jgi:hypothetical protein